MSTRTMVIVGVVVVIVIGLLWFFRGPIIGLVHPTPAPVAATPEVPALQTYASSTMRLSVQYPQDYVLNEAYSYDQFGPKKLIYGVKFTIPTAMATGTNLSSFDTGVSIEQLPHAKNCTGDIFLLDNVRRQTLDEQGTTYSLATSSGAGAGNRYEEQVYALGSSSPCTAVRYFIHYSAIENYPAGTVQEFDRAALLSDFDTIRHSLVVGQ